MARCMLLPPIPACRSCGQLYNYSGSETIDFLGAMSTIYNHLLQIWHFSKHGGKFRGQTGDMAPTLEKKYSTNDQKCEHGKIYVDTGINTSNT